MDKFALWITEAIMFVGMILCYHKALSIPGWGNWSWAWLIGGVVFAAIFERIVRYDERNKNK